MSQDEWSQGFVMGVISSISSKGVSEQQYFDMISDALTSIGFPTPHGLNASTICLQIKKIINFGVKFTFVDGVCYVDSLSGKSIDQIVLINSQVPTKLNLVENAIYKDITFVGTVSTSQTITIK